MFRHERPQRALSVSSTRLVSGRSASNGPDVDAELILMTADLWQRLGLRNIQLQLNTLAQPTSAAHREPRIRYLGRIRSSWTNSRRRLHSNPLRVLDTKTELQALVEAAPKLIDFIGDASRLHFDGLQALLRQAGIDFVINPRLVRAGLLQSDRVQRVTTELGSAKHLWRRPLIRWWRCSAASRTPACGFGMGIERLLLLMRANRGQGTGAAGAGSYVPALATATSVRTAGGAELRRAELAQYRCTAAAAASSRRCARPTPAVPVLPSSSATTIGSAETRHQAATRRRCRNKQQRWLETSGYIKSKQRIEMASIRSAGTGNR